MESQKQPLHHLTVRGVYLLLGWGFLVLGLVGALLPVLPTTPFLLLSLWAFSKSSEKLHDWLYHHPTFGPALQRWHQHRLVPFHAKVVIGISMTGSYAYLLIYRDIPLPILIAIGFVMVVVAGYLLSRPSQLQTESS